MYNKIMLTLSPSDVIGIDLKTPERESGCGRCTRVSYRMRVYGDVSCYTYHLSQSLRESVHILAVRAVVPTVWHHGFQRSLIEPNQS